MDPRTGEYVTELERRALPPAERERFSVSVEGSAEDVERLSEAVRLQGEYAKAVAILRAVKSFAHALGRSGNPGRRAAGKDLLMLFEDPR